MKKQYSTTRLFLAALVLLLSVSTRSYAQDSDSVTFKAPDLKAIEDVVKNNRSLYDSLTEKFKNADTSTKFTLEEGYIVYYGYAFTENYSPYSDFAADAVRALLEKGEIDNAEKTINEALEKNPVSITLYEYLYMIAQKKQDEDTFRKTSLKLMALLDAISMSGEGDEKESPLYVICVSDEYSFLRALGAKELLQQSLIETPSGHCDKMDFKIDVSSEDEEETSETTEKTITLYFNIELAFSKLSSIF